MSRSLSRMSTLYQPPPVPVLLDQCIKDDKGNVFCPVDESKLQNRPATGRQYASDDNLTWTQEIVNMPSTNTVQNLPVYTLHRTSSDPNLPVAGLQQYTARPQNIDKNPQQIFSIEPVSPPSNPSQTQIQQYTNPVSPQYTMSHPAAMPPPVVQPHYHQTRKPVNMNRALGMSMLMSCLCPPIGLCGLGAALKGRRLRYKNPNRAYRYKMVSYTMSILAVILIVLGIVIIVLLAEKQYI